MNYRPHHAKSRRAGCLLAAAAPLLLAAPAAFADTWIGPGTDWNTAANWSPAAVPNSFTDDVIFGDTGVGTVNISSGVVARSITFTNTAGDYTLTSSASQGLGITTITIAPNVTGFEQINLATFAPDSLQAPFFSNITVTNNSVAGGVLSIGSTTVIGVFGGAGGVVFQGLGVITLNATFASTPAVQVNGLTKNGPGSLDFTGNGAALLGATTLNGGTLILDFGASTAAKASSGASLVLNNGILQVTANAKNVVTQAYTGGTTFNGGHTDIKGGGGTFTLNLSGITRSAGATTDVLANLATFTVATSAGNTNGLLGNGTAFATANHATTWATASGGKIVGLPEASYQNNIVGSGVNADLTGGQFIGLTVNSIRFSTANDSFNLLSPGTLQSGGILVSPFATGAAITGDTLTASNGEFVFHVYSDDGFLVSSPLIASNGLTKTGPGNLTLAGNNASLTGPININRGSLTITTTAAVNSASTINFNDGRQGDVLQLFKIDLGDNTTGTISAPISVSAFSVSDYGTYFSTGLSNNSFVTLSGTITSAPGLTTPIRFSPTPPATPPSPPTPAPLPPATSPSPSPAARSVSSPSTTSAASPSPAAPRPSPAPPPPPPLPPRSPSAHPPPSNSPPATISPPSRPPPLQGRA